MRSQCWTLLLLACATALLPIGSQAGLGYSVMKCDATYGNPESIDTYEGYHERFYRMRGKKLLGTYELCVRVLFHRGKAVATSYTNMKGDLSDAGFSPGKINSKETKKGGWFNEGRAGDTRPHSFYIKKSQKTGLMRHASTLSYCEHAHFDRVIDWCYF